jgi:hypothetical protein
VAIPCVSSWGYERTNRWNCDAIDPNRIFRADGPALKANALIGRDEWHLFAHGGIRCHRRTTWIDYRGRASCSAQWQGSFRMKILCLFGLHRWRGRARKNVSTFTRCGRCSHPGILRKAA